MEYFETPIIFLNKNIIDINDKDENKITPLNLVDGFTIEHLEEDSFIIVTSLCKAGNKQFKYWFRLDKTKAFLETLS